MDSVFELPVMNVFDNYDQINNIFPDKQKHYSQQIMKNMKDDLDETIHNHPNGVKIFGTVTKINLSQVLQTLRR